MSEDKRNWLSQPAFVFYEQKDLEEYMKNTILSVETAAIMKCAEVCEKAAHGVAGAGIFAEAVRALIPQDGRTQLEQKCMEVANAAFDFGYYDCESPAVDCVEPKLRAIVTNLIGEKK